MVKLSTGREVELVPIKIRDKMKLGNLSMKISKGDWEAALDICLLGTNLKEDDFEDVEEVFELSAEIINKNVLNNLQKKS